MQVEFMQVTGMRCDHCVSRVTSALKEVPGVGDARVSLAAGEALVEFDERLISPEQLKAAVLDAGYGVDGTEPLHGYRHGQGGCGGHAAGASAAASAVHRHGAGKGCRG